MVERHGRVRLTTRLLVAFAVVFLVLIGGLGFLVDLSIRGDLEPGELATVRRDLAAAAALAGLVGVVVVGVVAHLLARPLRRLATVATSIADGRVDLRPERSSVTELDRLGVAIGRTASELGSRLAQLEGERRRLEVVLEALDLGVLLVAGDDTVLYANAATEVLLATRPVSLAEVTPVALRRIVADARAEAQPTQDEVEHGTPSRTLHVTVTPLDDGGVLVVLEDISERRRLEAIRRDFVADASHEMKTPVAGILASVEAAETALVRDPERVRGFLDQASASARHLARLVGDLLDLSRLEVAEPQRQPVALDEVVRDEVERAGTAAEQAGVRLEFDVAPVTVIGARADLGLAVGNLIENAIRYSAPGGTVEVRLRVDGDLAEVTVRDTGIGIPTWALPRVFERFFRVDAARSRATGGTGLGLAIVKHVVERHGGTVDVTSELGVGSTFRMRIPISAA